MPVSDGTDGPDLFEIGWLNYTPTRLRTGGGSDIIRFTPAMDSPTSYLILDDFSPGDGGDIIDIMPFLDWWLQRPFIGTGWVPGSDPFATGHLALIQDGPNVALLVGEKGSAAEEGSRVAVFPNRHLADFTAANFSGLVPAGPSATETRFVRTEVVLSSTTDLTIDTPDLYPLSQFLSPDRTAFVMTGGSQLVNHGRVTVSDTQLPSDEDHGALVGLGVYGGTLFRNGPEGRFLVDSTVTFQGEPHVGSTSGLWEVRSATPIVNEGLFEVRAASGTAYGVNGLGRTSAAIDFRNSGTLRVTSAYEAYGVYAISSKTIDNSGLISVSGLYAATAIRFGGVSENGTLNNSGIIEAFTDLASPLASIGISLWEITDVMTVVNTGRITADIAIIVEGDYQRDGADDYIINRGIIEGAVLTAYGADTVENSGIMTGPILLGDGNDRYLGSHGDLIGYVSGGPGDDEVVGGASSERIYGDDGDDLLIGGDGDDFIEGGWGRDIMSGGPGFDTLSFAESLLPVSVDLRSNWSSDGVSQDAIDGFEGVLGSRFSDSLIGSNADETLFGEDGDDTLKAIGGSDVLWGGRGNDDLSGGSGRDLFLFTQGDGTDTIHDFGSGDIIAVHGYAGALRTEQVGSDVVVTLSDTDRLIVRSASLATVQAVLVFDPAPLERIAPIEDAAIFSTGDFHLGIGQTIALTNPTPAFVRHFAFEHTAFLIADGTVFNAGGLVSRSSQSDFFIGIQDYTFSNTRHSAVVNLAGATIDVTSPGETFGMLGNDQIFNAGLLRVTSSGGSAVGAADISDQFVNSGTIDVRGEAQSFALKLDFNSRSAPVVVNSGTIVVSGAGGSAGLQLNVGAHPAATGPDIIVNSGSIIVRDSTAALDSAGLLLSWTGRTAIFNSGTIDADFAIKFSGFSSSLGSALSIINSGNILGAINLKTEFETDKRQVLLVNSGTVRGDVILGFDSDTFDGRDGLLVGTLWGEAGNDVLLTGRGMQHLIGGNGDDLLSGGADDDVLTGGAGADRFRFETGFGSDTVADFSRAEGDRIEVRGYAAYASLSQVGSNVVVSFAGGDRLVLANQLVVNVTADWFVFGAPPIDATPVASLPKLPSAPATPLFDRFGSSIADFWIGTADPEHMRGFSGDDSLHGGAGNDRIDGGDGADIISGGDGRDVLIGGNGIDTFRDTAAGLSGDVIADFGPQDRIVITDADPARFEWSFDGAVLTYSGGNLNFAQPVFGRLLVKAAPEGGIQLTLSPALGTLTQLFSPPTTVAIANFNPASGWTNQDQFPRHVADMNGDGFADIVGFGIAGVYVARGTASGQFALPTLVLAQFNAANGWTSDSQYHRALADLNGDGRADIVGFGVAGIYTSVVGPGGSYGLARFALNNFGADQGWTSQDRTARISGDVNGDGHADIVGFGFAGTWVGLGNGDGTFQAARFGIANFGINQGWSSDNIFHRELADVNGDGKDDIIGFGIAGTYVALSNGNGTFGAVTLALNTFGTAQGWSSNDAFSRIATDVNGDHLADIVGFTFAGPLVAIGNGDGTFQIPVSGIRDFGRDQGWTSDTVYHREIADVDGDGFADVIGFGSAGVLVATNLFGTVY